MLAFCCIPIPNHANLYMPSVEVSTLSKCSGDPVMIYIGSTPHPACQWKVWRFISLWWDLLLKNVMSSWWWPASWVRGEPSGPKDDPKRCLEGNRETKWEDLKNLSINLKKVSHLLHVWNIYRCHKFMLHVGIYSMEHLGLGLKMWERTV